MRRVHVALTVAGTAGIVLLFTPFAFDYVPVRDAVLDEGFWPSIWSVLPCIVFPLPIGIGYTLWLAHGRLPRWYALSAFVLITLVVALWLSFIAVDFSSDEAIYLAVMVLALCAVAGLSASAARRHPTLGSLVAMQGFYVFQISFFLLLALGDYQIGALLGLLASVAYLAQIAVVTDRRAWIALLVIPTILLFVGDGYGLF